ncbi:MAG TPA: hypothetical protein VF933_21380 [Streptosporangiaceae bacterium]
MAPALQAHPETVLDLLFDPGSHPAQALGREILSAGGTGELGHALADLPAVTREAAVREVSQAAAGLLDIDLIGLLVAGWRGAHDLAGAARRTLATPGGTELVNLASHQITVTRNPSVDVMVDNVRLARVQLGLSVVFDVSALVAGVSAGLLTALHAGRCDITATLVIQGTTVLTRPGHLELPGTVTLGSGIRLLPDRDYLAGPGRADPAAPAPDDG